MSQNQNTLPATPNSFDLLTEEDNAMYSQEETKEISTPQVSRQPALPPPPKKVQVNSQASKHRRQPAMHLEQFVQVKWRKNTGRVPTGPGANSDCESKAYTAVCANVKWNEETHSFIPCTRPNCTFAHTLAQLRVPKRLQCRFKPCRNYNPEDSSEDCCQMFHPEQGETPGDFFDRRGYIKTPLPYSELEQSYQPVFVSAQGSKHNSWPTLSRTNSQNRKTVNVAPARPNVAQNYANVTAQPLPQQFPQPLPQQFPLPAISLPVHPEAAKLLAQASQPIGQNSSQFQTIRVTFSQFPAIFSTLLQTGVMNVNWVIVPDEQPNVTTPLPTGDTSNSPQGQTSAQVSPQPSPQASQNPTP